MEITNSIFSTSELLITSESAGTSNNILCIDIVNPYITSLGFMDIMSGSEEKTPAESLDPGATDETTTSSGKEEVRTATSQVVPGYPVRGGQVIPFPYLCGRRQL